MTPLPSLYNMCEACPSLYERGHYLLADAWEAHVACGVTHERHMSLGRFSELDTTIGVGGTTYSLMPYLVLEHEAGTLSESLEGARQIVEALEATGIETGTLRARYSGNKSIHLLLPSGMLGNPVMACLGHSRLWSMVFCRWAEHLFTDWPCIELDVNLFDPRHLIRMPGSHHMKTWLYVIEQPIWLLLRHTAEELEELAQQLIKRPRSSAPYEVGADEVLVGIVDHARKIYKAHWEGRASEMEGTLSPWAPTGYQRQPQRKPSWT